jgi:hypothetical protein
MVFLGYCPYCPQDPGPREAQDIFTALKEAMQAGKVILDGNPDIRSSFTAMSFTAIGPQEVLPACHLVGMVLPPSDVLVIAFQPPLLWL